MGAYQHQPISVGVHLGVLDDVPIWHPRTHDTKRKQCLRNLNDREYVRMGDLLVPTNSRTKDLVRSTLNTHPKKKKKLVYLFNFSEADRVLCSNCFDAYRLPMITSFPGIPKSTELAMWRFVTQFYIGEYLRFTEEGIGIKSEQRAPMVTARFGGRESRYDLITGGFRN